MRGYLAALMLAVLVAACSPGSDLPVAENAVATFHQELNAGAFDTIYSNSSADMKRISSEPDMLKLYDAVHRKLGDFQSGSQTGWNDNVSTGGHFVTLVYASKYQRGAATENFVYRIDGDRAALAGYHVASNALIEN
jgi:hypothetical protein